MKIDVYALPSAVEGRVQRPEAHLGLGHHRVARLDLAGEDVVELVDVDHRDVGESLPEQTAYLPVGSMLTPCGLFGIGNPLHVGAVFAARVHHRHRAVADLDRLARLHRLLDGLEVEDVEVVAIRGHHALEIDAPSLL